jgi:uncharacterized membrane protein YoaK (UPF0700 family)
MKISLSLSLLRLGFLLVLIGFFAPIGCTMSGYQLAQGILGNTQQAGNAIILGSIEDVYGYLLLGVFISAFLGLVFTFVSRAHDNPLLETIGLAVSFILLLIVALRLKSFRNSGVPQLILTIIPIKLKLMIGGYSMAAGYLAGAVGITLKFLRR